MTDQAAAPTMIRAAGTSFFPIALIARLPFAMMTVGVLTLVVSARQSIALGGATSAVTGAGTALFSPVLGMAADRYGQRRVLLLVGMVNSALLLALARLVSSPAPDWTVLGLALLIGATVPQVAPMSRSRVVAIIHRHLPEDRRARVLGRAMAYESGADELVFVFGPVVVGVLATAVGPAAPVVGAALLGLVFVSAFALHPTADVGRADRTASGDVLQAPAGELLRPGLLVTYGGALGMGLVFGSCLTALTAFMEQRGAPEEAGLLYGAMGVGSAVFALGSAALPDGFSLASRWLVFATVLTTGAVGLATVSSVPALVVALFVVGIGIGPTLVVEYRFAVDRSPEGRGAAALTIFGSAVVVGQAGAAAVTGLVAERVGVAAALLTPMLAASVVLAAGVLNTALLRRGNRALLRRGNRALPDRRIGGSARRMPTSPDHAVRGETHDHRAETSR
ncbi:MAG: MFS transporter [Acidimicrobiales bacterium]